MQADRRHELKENTLAHGLNTWSEKLRPYTSLILGVVAALLGVYIVASMWNSYQESRDRAAWDDYQLAVLEGDIDQRRLRRLADSEDHAGTDMQEWALMGWADRQLLRASQLYLTSRDEAIDRVNDVIGVYEQFASTAQNPELRNRAQLGLARAFEMKGDLKQAKANYGRVQGALAVVAEQRLRELEGDQVEATTKWLATAELPKPTTPGGPGTPGERPGFEATLPATDAASGAAEAAMSEIFGALGEQDPSRYEEPAEDAAATEATAEGADADAAAAPEAEDAGDDEEDEPVDAEGATPPAEPAADTPAAEAPVEEQPAAADAPAEQ